jgi:hypothetical protein
VPDGEPDCEPDCGLSQVDEPLRDDGEVVLLLVPLSGDPGNWAVWHAGRGSLGVQSAGIWLDRPLLPDIGPDGDELPWFWTELGLSLGDTF